MKFGLIGYPLGHSWSKEIHAYFNPYSYELFEIEPSNLKRFMEEKQFDGINVTIPYKQEVMQYLDAIDEVAEKIGAVNCIVNENGKLKGYNTDYAGFQTMLIENNIDVKGKCVAVLGTGGASKAVSLALQDLGASVTLVSRTKKENAITYAQLYQHEDKYQVLVNTTPVGMYPNTDALPIDIKQFHHLEAVVDVIANPLRTRLQFEAKCAGIRTLGGFEMLVRQAFVADEYFLNKKLDGNLVKQCMQQMLQKRRNIVFIGMPTAGKTTLSKNIAKVLQTDMVEMDDEIVDVLGTSIKTCFETKGEMYFRDIEKQVAKNHKEANGKVISCGGGVIKVEDTMRYLSENGCIVWIQRNLEELYPTDSRPLSSSEEALQKLYEERKPLYTKYSDIQIENNGTISETIQKIIERLGDK